VSAIACGAVGAERACPFYDPHPVEGVVVGLAQGKGKFADRLFIRSNNRMDLKEVPTRTLVAKTAIRIDDLDFGIDLHELPGGDAIGVALREQSRGEVQNSSNNKGGTDPSTKVLKALVWHKWTDWCSQ